MRTSCRALDLNVVGAILAFASSALACSSEATPSETDDGGTAGTMPSGAGGLGGSGGSATAGTGGSAAGTGGNAGGGTAGSTAGAGASGSAGTGGAGMSGTGGAGSGGAAGSAGSTAGSASGGAGSSGTGGDAGASGGGSGGTSGGASGSAGQGGAGGGTGGGGTGGAVDCAGRAISMSANGTGQDSDAAFARVEIDLGTDLPTGNTNRTFEFWALIKTTDWVGEKNEVYYYGGSGTAAAFGLDFGTNAVMGQPQNHATLNPFTGGGFNDDSTNDLGITSTMDQWVHIAMTWNGTNVITYVNGQPKITTSGSGASALATAQSVVLLGCNSSNNQCFNGLFDELRIWKVARSASEIAGSYNKSVAGNEANLVGYYKFEEMNGTTTADAVTGAGHTAHPGTLKADMAAHNPTFVTPPMPAPITCL